MLYKCVITLPPDKIVLYVPIIKPWKNRFVSWCDSWRPWTRYADRFFDSTSVITVANVFLRLQGAHAMHATLSNKANKMCCSN